MSKLKREEISFIERREKDFKGFLKRIEAMQRFQLGDYLIGFEVDDPDYHSTSRPEEPILNSYGLPTKFKVVAVDKNGIPYLKELNKKGLPFGRLISTVEFHQDHGEDDDLIFKIDPDYTDSILLGESEFDPTKIQKVKSSLHKDITKHNKQNKINTYDLKSLETFLNTLSVGSTVWKSNTKSWTVIKIIKRTIPKDARGCAIKWETPLLEVQDSKGLIFEVTINDIRYKAFYQARPRTYKELNDI
jgi:hypothetical protein